MDANLSGSRAAWNRAPRLSVDYAVMERATDVRVVPLDAGWDEAPFASHEQLVATVERVATEWEGSGLLTGSDRAAIVDAARQAETELSV